MKWYWWVIIVAGAALAGWLKLTVLGTWMKKRKERQKPVEDE